MDDVAREYLLIALSLGELEDGIVDSYYGPAEIRAEALAAKSTPADLRKRAHALRARLGEVTDAQRARYLDRQLVALETLAGQLDGEQIPYRELVERCFDAAPEATPPEEYARVRAELERLLPGDGDVRQRLEAQAAALTVPVDLLAGIVEWLTNELRAAAGQSFFVPAGEDLTISLVKNEPWGAYNWYDGNLRSRIEVNTDLPVRAPRLMDLLAHEGFPGHHLEHATKEARLVREQGRFESSVQLINTPEAYISEGLADTGVRFVAPEKRWQELLLGICQRAGIPMTEDEALLNWHIRSAIAGLRGSQGDAALPAPRRRPTRRRGHRVSRARRAGHPRPRGQDARVHHPSAVARIRLLLRRRGAAADRLDRAGGQRGGRARALRSVAERAADALGDCPGDDSRRLIGA
jgi:hypothetical protein